MKVRRRSPSALWQVAGVFVCACGRKPTVELKNSHKVSDIEKRSRTDPWESLGTLSAPAEKADMNLSGGSKT